MSDWEERVEKIRQNPADSYWLKAAVEACLERDPVKAINDVEFLWHILDEKLEEMLKSSPSA